ncbi:MAG: hypothetical protein Q8P25_00880 [Candidatus Curtissbacteria bacterium]|nr:hypothetical protein [Candidatus Curtissbacteria bacterium]
MEKEVVGHKLTKTLGESVQSWLADPARAYPVSIDPSIIFQGTSTTITETEVQFGGLQRKLVYASSNWYAFYNDGTDVLYKKSSNGTSWGSNVDVDTADADNYNPSVWLEGTTIYAAWIDDSGDAVEVNTINTASSDALGTKCTSADQGTIDTASFTVSISVADNGTVYLAYSDTSTDTEAAVLKLTFSGCTFTDITGESGTLAFDAVANSTCTACSSLTYSHTTSGSNRLLLVFVGFDDFPANITDVTYGGVSLTFVDGQTVGGRRIELWRLIAPATGANDVVASFSANTAILAGSMSYAGVNQTTPLGTAAKASGVSTSASVDVSSGTGEIVADGVLGVFAQPQSFTVGGGQTERWNQEQGDMDQAGSTEPGATTVTMSWTASCSCDWTIVGVSVKRLSYSGLTTESAANRFYLPSTGAAAVSPGYDSAWEDTTIAARLAAVTTKIASAMSTVAFTDADSTSRDILFRQYVSAPLAAGQTITGAQALKFQIRALQPISADGMCTTIGIRVIAADGSTVQKTVLTVTRDNTVVATSLTNRQFTATSAATDYTTVAGDRLVIEVGTGGDPIITSHTTSLRIGDASGSDLPENDTTTTDNNPWVGFTDNIAFAPSTGARPVLVTIGNNLHMVYQDGNLSASVFDGTSWTTSNTTIASVTDNIYSVTTDGTNLWALTVSGTTATNFYKFNGSTWGKSSIDIDTDVASGDANTTSDAAVSIYCPAQNDCKLAYFDKTDGDITFVDCNGADCDAPTINDVDTDVGSTARVDLDCPTAADCKIAYFDSTDGDITFADCANVACSSLDSTAFDIDTDVGTSASVSISCGAGAGDCKVVYFDDTDDDVTFVDCDAVDCSTNGGQQDIDADVGSGFVSVSAVDCLAGASFDCKIVYFDNGTDVGGTGDITFADCATANCATRDAISDIDTDVGSYGKPALDCPTAADCKVVYFDSTDGDVTFADCANAACSSFDGGGPFDIDTDVGTAQYEGFVDIHCPAADDCKVSYADTTDRDINFVDCNDAACSAPTINDLKNATHANMRPSIFCPSDGTPTQAQDCKVFFFDDWDKDVTFIDCTDAACSNTLDQPFSGETNLTSASLTYDSTNSDLIAYVIKDSAEQVYADSSDATTIDWTGSGANFNFVGNDLGHISSPATAAGTAQSGVVVRRGKAFEFSNHTHIQAVDTTNDVGRYTSIYCVATDDCKIAYYDQSGGDLEFYDCDNAKCTTGTATSIDTANNTGHSPSLACVSSTDCKISYYDTTAGDLIFRDCDNSACSTGTTTTIDGCVGCTVNGDVGNGSALDLGSDGFARISYYDTTTDDLRFIQCTNATCSARNNNAPDTTITVSAFPDSFNIGIKLDSSGNAQIAYFSNGSPQALKFVHCTNAACSTTDTIQTIDGTGSAGLDGISLAIGSDGFSRIAYYDFFSSGDFLKFVRCTNVSCSTNSGLTRIERVSSGADIRLFASLRLDAADIPRISYYYDNQDASTSGTVGDLKFLVCGNTDCTSGNNFQTLDSANNTGQYSSMFCLSVTDCKISYYQVTNGDLRFIDCETATCSGGSKSTVAGGGSTEEVEAQFGGLQRKLVYSGIAFDNASSSNAITNSLSFNHTVTTNGANRILTVGVAAELSGGATITGVTYSSTSLSLVQGVSFGNSRRVELWRLVNPPTGTNSVVVSLSASKGVTAGAMSFTGVNQLTPFGTVATNTSTSNAVTVDVTSAKGEMVIDAVGVESVAVSSVGAGQTQRYNVQQGVEATGAGSTEEGAGTVTMSWGLAATANWGTIGVPLKPVGGAFYAFYTNGVSGDTCSSTNGCQIYYQKSTDGGTTWLSSQTVDTTDTDNYNPSVWLEGNTIYVAWIDDSSDAIEVNTINTANDTLGTKCTSADQGSIDTTSFTVSVAVADNGTVYVAYSDTSTDTEVAVFKLTFSGCTFTDITGESGSASRFYLPSTGAAAISPAYDAAWENVSIAARLAAVTTKIASAMSTVAFDDSDNADKDILFRQYVGAALTPGQTITGGQALKFQIRGFKAFVADGMRTALGVRIVNTDGSIVRKTVLAVTRDNVTLSTAALTNRQFTATSAAGNYTTVAGDRLVIEVGTGGDPFAAAHDSSLRIGDASGTDLPENDTSTTDNNPWVELADSLTFTSASGLTAGDRPVLVTIGNNLHMVYQDGDLSASVFDGSSWTTSNATIASVTDNVYSVTTDNTNLWVLTVSGTTATNFYKFNGSTWSSLTAPWPSGETELESVSITYDLENGDLYAHTIKDSSDQAYFKTTDETMITSTPSDIDTDVGSAAYASIYCLSASDCKVAYFDRTDQDVTFADCNDAACSAPTITDIDTAVGLADALPSIYCPAGDDCKIIYFDLADTDLTFADCNDATCSAPTITDIDTTVNSNYRPSIYCPAADDCKVAYHDDVDQDVTFADCNDATCSAPTLTDVDTDVGTFATTSIYCPSAIDCKVVYFDGNEEDVSFADCNDATCSAPTINDIDTDVGSAANASIYCPQATDCKVAYFDTTDQDITFADCNDATCSAPTINDIDTDVVGNFWAQASIYCPSAIDCKVVYFDGNEEDVSFADCNDATCSAPTITDIDTAVGGGIDSSVPGVYCLSASDCKVAYFDGTDGDITFADCNSAACLLGWGASTSYAFTAGDLGHISSTMTGYGTSQIGVVLRQGTNFEFAPVPERTLYLLLATPLAYGLMSRLKKKKNLVQRL